LQHPEGPAGIHRKHRKFFPPCKIYSGQFFSNILRSDRVSLIVTIQNGSSPNRSLCWTLPSSTLRAAKSRRLAFAYQRPSSQTRHDHREHTVHEFDDQFLAFPKGVRRFLSETVFSRSGNVGAVYCLTKSQVEGGYFYRRPSGDQALFQTPSTKPSFNTHSSRSGSVQRILSGVPAPGLSHSANFLWGAPPIECSSISDKYFRDCRLTCARLCHIAGVELEQIQFCLGHVSVEGPEVIDADFTPLPIEPERPQL
jgi:hypothetical protein